MKISLGIISIIMAMVSFTLIASGFNHKEIHTKDNIYDSSVSINTQADSTNSRKLLGSGVIISKDGLIVTNYHVVYSAPSLSIKFNNGLYAENVSIVKLDKENDLALLKVDKKFSKKQVAKFESLNNIYKGQPVIAVGTPLNEKLFNLATHGIVSNKNVSIEMTYNDSTSTTVLIKNCLLLDFQTNGGNSGGPLFNTSGKLIGIMSSTNYKQGISLAISLEAVNNFLKYKDI